MNARFMMSAVLPDVIDECILSCPLCLREAHQPKLLPCLHVCCQLCLQDYIKQWQDKQQQQQQQQVHQQQQQQQHHQQQQQQQQHIVANNLRSSSEPKSNINLSVKSSQSDEVFDRDHHDDQNGHYDEPADPNDGEKEERVCAPTKNGEGQRRSLERSKDKAVSPEMADFYRNRYKLQRFDREQNADDSNYENFYETPDRRDDADDDKAASPESSIVLQDAKRTERDVEPNLGHSNSRSHSVEPSHDATALTDDAIGKAINDGLSGDKRKSSSSLSGHVSSMVHIFESKSSPEMAPPPMAQFRAKSTQSSAPARLVPLHQRQLPIYSHHMTRSQSHHHQPFHDPALASLPRSISLNAQTSGRIGLSNKRILEKRVSLSDHQYEIPECLETTNDAIHSERDLAAARQSLLRRPKPVSGDSSKSQRRRPSNLLIVPSKPPLFSRTPSEHIYDEITSLSPTDGSTLLSPTRSLLREGRPPKSKDDHDLPRSRRSVRRNSSILDSYVMAGALASTVSGQNLNVEIPLSTDDSTRLSELYLRMDSTVLDRRSRTSQRYMTMDKMRSLIEGRPTPRAAFGSSEETANLDNVESIATLIRAISSEFDVSRKTGDDPVESEPTRETADPEMSDNEGKFTPPAIYMNVPDRVQPDDEEEELELDAAVPVYDTPSTPISPYQILQAPIKNKDSAQPGRDAAAVRVPCPVCGRVFASPSQVDDCTFVSQLEDVVSSQKCERKTCGNCEARTATFKCLDCFVYLCNGCRNGHNWSMANRGHKVMTLQQLQTGKYQADMKQSQKTFCQRDQTNEAKYLCAQCKQMECSDCALLYCNNHHIRPIDEVARRDRDFIEAKLQDLQHHQDTLNGAVENLHMYQHHCSASRDDILDQLTAQEEYIKLLTERTFDLLRTKVKQTFAREHQIVSDVKTTVQASMSSLRHVTKFTNQLLLHGNHANVVALAPVVKEELCRIQDIVPPRMTSQLEVRYVPQEVDLRSIQKLCGLIEPVTSNLDGTQHGTDTYELIKQNIDILEPIREFHTKIANDNKGCRPNGLTVLSNGHLVLADNINMKLKCFDVMGQLQWDICPNGDHMLVDPWDVTVLDNGIIAVTDKGTKDVKLFKQDGQFVTSYGSHLKEPWAICRNSRQEMLVTDLKLCRIFVHDVSGKLLNTIPAQSVNTRFKLEYPEYITCNKSDDIIVSDFEKHCILVFDLLGRPLFTFGRKGTGFDEFYYPLGVSTDAEGNIYAVNYKNKRITVVKRNGAFLCCLGTREPMHSLQAIAIGRDGHLVVIDGSFVKIFPLPPRILANAVSNNNNTDYDEKTTTRSDILLLHNDDEDDLDLVIRKETTV